ncbi:response regulator [Bacillus sp. FJAT-26390]|uniref:response regulator n=1 Tax=Bacillus sp. FJAT-26390 TaxID=1743142 RepID=UPI000807FBB5|nr:response regulator [Bacillus sp. FJAT-26390]OBZ13682.1 DNA-binding response regulator [Bacillus sp. FJAT-26390]
MYKMIIVDDEDEVREGVERLTDWKRCGFELVGDFSNGRDALEAVERLRPDVVITDINMPYMDGMELAAHLSALYRELKVVILTGYEDFEYAKQAIKLKVKDYLLKPINLQEFTDFLLKMKRELDDEQSRMEDMSALKQRLNESFPLLRERFLEKLVTVPMTEHDIVQKLDYFHLSIEGPAYLAMLLDLEDADTPPVAAAYGDRELLRFAMLNIAQEIIEKEHGGIVFQTNHDKCVALLGGAAEKIAVDAQRLAAHASEAVRKYLKLDVSIGIGSFCQTRRELRISYQEAYSALDYRFLLGIGSIISIHDVEFGRRMSTSSYYEFEKKLMAAVKTAKAAQASAILGDWFLELKQSGATPGNCYGYLHRILAALINMITQAGFDDSKLLGDDPFATIPALKSVDQMKGWVDETCRSVIAFLSEQRTHVNNTQLEDALMYINDHYSSPELSLQQVCQHVFLSLSYFSSLFKQHTGDTFVEYLTRLRLDKAKQLLAGTQLKAYDIAERVGYADPQYFSVIFKRRIGMTPKEYRATMKENASP